MTTPANFYPRPPRGGRPFSLGILPPVSIFLSTPSARRATPAHALCDPADDLFLSTPSARRATIYRFSTGVPILDFYPRPPRGGRLEQTMEVFIKRKISIHALREEGDVLKTPTRVVFFRFLSTPSARRATYVSTVHLCVYIFLSTPSARRATTINVLTKRRCIISIHALREEGDRLSSCIPFSKSDFYPRPPRGGRRSQPPPEKGIW